MHLRFSQFVLLWLLVPVHLALADTRGARSLVEPRSVEDTFSGSYALVIGIDAYGNGWQPLRNAVADAKAVADALEAVGFDVTRVLDPSRSELIDSIESFVYGPGADPDARLLIWYAGHGHTIDDVGYLVPREAPAIGASREEDAEFRRVALSLRRLDAEYLREVRARHVLAVFDSCFSGTIFNENRSAELPPSVRFAAANPVVQIITSGQAGEQVRDDGIFRRMFVDAVTGQDRRMLTDEGFLLGSRLGGFLAETLPNYSGGFQHPAHGKLSVFGRDRGDFVFPVRYSESEGVVLAQGPVSTPDTAVPPSATASPAAPVASMAPELRILLPETATDSPDATFIAQKLSRNLVELFAANGLPTSNKQTARAATRAPTHVFASHISVVDNEAYIHVELRNADGETLDSSTFNGPLEFWRRHYKVLPETALYALDISPTSLASLRTARRPTREPFAYAMFLAAREQVEKRRYDEALHLLKTAVEEVDPSFAAVYGAMAEITRLALDDAEAARRYEQEALMLDPDFPRLPIFSPNLLGDPLPQLRIAARSVAWRALADGVDERVIAAENYDVALHAWRFDPDKYVVDLVPSDNAFGNTAGEFRAKHDAVLAINAGFFDIDLQSRLSPVGLMVVGGNAISEFDLEKSRSPLSGVLYLSDERLRIDFAREYDTQRPVDMALQSGPLIVDPGGQNGIRRNAYDRLNRSAVCLDFDGSALLVLAWGGLSLYEFGAMLSLPVAEGGLGCERAINLDGGPSSQVSLALPDYSYDIPGLWRVNSALVVKPKH